LHLFLSAYALASIASHTPFRNVLCSVANQNPQTIVLYQSEEALREVDNGGIEFDDLQG
jgi:hypothetical protein